MASWETNLNGADFDATLRLIEKRIVDGSISASLEEACDYRIGSARCSVRVFERYSYSGGNRVSMSVTLFESEGELRLFAATSGGSQALFCKLNTLGEKTFLDEIKYIFE